jgi:ABC-type transporter Mla maintaining outer membrane lipid asymmetry permease subunit MlaE
MLFMMPALAIWADFMGVVGGCVFGVAAANFTIVSYFQAPFRFSVNLGRCLPLSDQKPWF